MEVKIESSKIKNRGVILTSQNLEEKEILLNIWNKEGRPVSLERKDGNISVTIAPTPVPEDRKGEVPNGSQAERERAS